VRRPRQKRWVVREGDGATVADILRRAGEPPSAVDEGRVFVGRVRVRSSTERVRPGVEVTIGAASPVSPAARASSPILWQRDELVACDKPPGIPTVPDHAGAAHSLVALVAGAVGLPASDLRVTSRLDREVSGVVVLATSEAAEARLKRAREEGAYARRYVAIATTADALPARGAFTGAIGAGKDARHRAVDGAGAKPSTTRYRVVARAPGGFALLAVEPITGRTHQIRIHTSHAGAPLLGDRDYGGPSRLTPGDGRVVALGRIALHAARVTVPGASGEPLVAEARIPEELAQVWAELGGDREAWNTAVSCGLEGDT